MATNPLRERLKYTQFPELHENVNTTIEDFRSVSIEYEYKKQQRDDR